MTPIQLYTLVLPDLVNLDYTKTYGLCTPIIYFRYNNCSLCPYSKSDGSFCYLKYNNNPNAVKLKEMIKIKHPEFFI